MTRLTRAGFRKWLLTLEPRQDVGEPNNNSDCPLCKYCESRGSENPLFLFRSFRFDRQEPYQDCPKWMEKFQRIASRGMPKHITAARALKILESIK